MWFGIKLHVCVCVFAVSCVHTCCLFLSGPTFEGGLILVQYVIGAFRHICAHFIKNILPGGLD